MTSRIARSGWTKSTTAGPVDFVNLDVAYDRASNVVSVKDNIYPGFDVLYSNDGLNRLTDADEGTLSGGLGRCSISLDTRLGLRRKCPDASTRSSMTSRPSSATRPSRSSSLSERSTTRPAPSAAEVAFANGPER